MARYPIKCSVFHGPRIATKFVTVVSNQLFQDDDRINFMNFVSIFTICIADKLYVLDMHCVRSRFAYSKGVTLLTYRTKSTDRCELTSNKPTAKMRISWRSVVVEPSPCEFGTRIFIEKKFDSRILHIF